MKLDLNNILFIIVFFNLLFISTASIFNKSGKSISRLLFSLFLLSKVICFSVDFLHYNLPITKGFTSVFFIGLTFDLILGPLLLFYIRSLIHKNFKLRFIDLLHFIPALFHLIYMSVIFYSKSYEEKEYLIVSQAIHTNVFTFINSIVIYSFFVVYAVISIIEILNYHKIIKLLYANFYKHQLRWMIILITSLALIWITGIVDNILFLLETEFNIPLAFYLILIFFFMEFIFFYGLYHAQVFSGIKDTESIDKYKKTIIPAEKKDIFLKKILEYTEQQKAYLDIDISINKMAKEIGIPAYQISQTLNSELHKNFFEFINHYRIKESMEILSDPSNHRITVLEVLYEVGFNSKSAFNKAFKKYTGQTPTQYRNTLSLANNS